jgi:hypothetical protein
VIRKGSFPWRKALLALFISLLACAALLVLFLGLASVAAGLKHQGAPGSVTPLATGVLLCIAALLGLLRGAKAIAAALKEK